MRPTVIASIALASGLVAGAAFAQTPTRSCVRVEVSSEVAGAPPTRSAAPPARSTALTQNVLVADAPRFSATRVLDLTFTVLFPASLSGEHVVELRVFTPDAQLYRSLALPFARGAQPGSARAVEGYARPVPQQPLTQVTRGRSAFAAASTTMPVGGTDIVSSGLYGRWRVEAYLDGAAQRCAAAAPFILNP